MCRFLRCLITAITVAGCSSVLASEVESSSTFDPINLDGFYDVIKHWDDRTGENAVPNYQPHQIDKIADNLLLYQRDSGGWPTNKHPLRIVSAKERAQILQNKRLSDASFDNRNIYPQIEYLSEAFQQTGNEKYHDAALRGIRYTLDRQYPNGGWAHSPDRTERAYYRHITIADEVMPGVLGFLRKVASGQQPYAYIDSDLRQQVSSALSRGDSLLLKLQVKMNGKLTGWAGQYHEETLQPVRGRTYELPGILAWETVPVLEYLMSIDEPSPEVIAAIHGGAEWLNTVKLNGFRIDEVAIKGERFEYHAATHDRVVVPDPDAKPIWARFYDLETNKPFLANRDGKRVAQLSDVDIERRTGYSWYGYWPDNLLSTSYPQWNQKHNEQ